MEQTTKERLLSRKRMERAQVEVFGSQVRPAPSPPRTRPLPEDEHEASKNAPIDADAIYARWNGVARVDE